MTKNNCSLEWRTVDINPTVSKCIMYWNQLTWPTMRHRCRHWVDSEIYIIWRGDWIWPRHNIFSVIFWKTTKIATKCFDVHICCIHQYHCILKSQNIFGHAIYQRQNMVVYSLHTVSPYCGHPITQPTYPGFLYLRVKVKPFNYLLLLPLT